MSSRGFEYDEPIPSHIGDGLDVAVVQPQDGPQQLVVGDPDNKDAWVASTCVIEEVQ